MYPELAELLAALADGVDLLLASAGPDQAVQAARHRIRSARDAAHLEAAMPAEFQPGGKAADF
jgi:hypothetical protein